MSLNQPKIFISHSWQDKPLVRRLEKELQSAGAEVWVDHEDIRGGDNLPERISEALEWCNTLVLVWTKAASQSRWVKLEWTNAISLEKAIIPCRVDNAALPAILAHMKWVGFGDVEAGLAQLLLSLQLKKTSAEVVIHLRKTPATLSEADIKSMLLKYNFYCHEYEWNRAWCNPQGKGIGNKFELRQNGLVVFDQRTGLMWQRSGSSQFMALLKVDKFVHDMNAQRYAGFNDWRLPTLEEGMSLVEHEVKSNGSYIDPMFDRTQDWIWTADKHSGSSCWVANFSDGCYSRRMGHLTSPSMK